MERNIIVIDEEKCNGCGACIAGCHEGALALIDGKARLISETYCDGLGACLPECPTGAITIEKRAAAAFTAPAPGSPADLEEKAKAAQAAAARKTAPATRPQGFGGCPGSAVRSFQRGNQDAPAGHGHGHSHFAQGAAPVASAATFAATTRRVAPGEANSELQQWPCQIKLVPVQAPYFNQARLLIAADCTAFARASFHEEFIKGRIAIIGCPKLDMGNYADKLTEIFRLNEIKSIMVARMEVPCCGGIEAAVRQALQASGKMIPWQVVTISTDGRILED